MPDDQVSQLLQPFQPAHRRPRPPPGRPRARPVHRPRHRHRPRRQPRRTGPPGGGLTIAVHFPACTGTDAKDRHSREDRSPIQKDQRAHRGKLVPFISAVMSNERAHPGSASAADDESPPPARCASKISPLHAGPSVVCGESALSLDELNRRHPHRCTSPCPRLRTASISYPPNESLPVRAGTFDFARRTLRCSPGDGTCHARLERSVERHAPGPSGRTQSRPVRTQPVPAQHRPARRRRPATGGSRTRRNARHPSGHRSSARLMPNPRDTAAGRIYNDLRNLARPHRRTDQPGHARVSARTLPLPHQHPPTRPCNSTSASATPSPAPRPSNTPST